MTRKVQAQCIIGMIKINNCVITTDGDLEQTGV